MLNECLNADLKANWTVRRVRGSILHNLAEIGHHRHPFRLKFKGAYLQDGNTLYDSGIFDNVAVELIPLATHAELQSDLFWRYVPNRTPSSDPHLKALAAEINIFNKIRALQQVQLLTVVTLKMRANWRVIEKGGRDSCARCVRGG